MKNLFETCVAELGEIVARRYARWEARVCNWKSSQGKDTDELGVHIGKGVCTNCRADGVLEKEHWRRLILQLLRLFGRSGDGITSFEDTCFDNQRLGPQRDVTSIPLWRIIPEIKFKNTITTAHGFEAVWKKFCDAFERKEEKTVARILRGEDISRVRFSHAPQVFATFKPQDGRSWADPDLWIDNAAHPCAALGLSIDWEGYRKGDTLWLLKYRLLPPATGFLPSVSDAGFNSIFLPSTSASSPHGLTRFLGPYREYGEKGMPELIHHSPFIHHYLSPPPNPSGEARVESIRRLRHSGWEQE